MLLENGRLDYQYFTVREQAIRDGRKLPTFKVLSGSGDTLGSLAWYGPWRQFVLTPREDTVWSTGCLADIQDALRKIAAARRS